MKILVIHYSQTGQLTNILNSILAPLIKDEKIEVTFLPILPEKEYVFPWSGFGFFDVFPESVIGEPVQLLPMNPDENADYDLIVLGYQIWFLSPSIPFNSFLLSDTASKLLRNKKVITVIGARNMWAMAQEKVKAKLSDLGAGLIGNIVLCDNAGNFTSIITIVRWLIWGKKNKFGIFPSAGVSDRDIITAQKFGKIIQKHLSENQNSESNISLQDKLLTEGAVKVIPHIIDIEKKGSRIFKIWATQIRKRGTSGSKPRNILLRIFMIYLPIAIVVASPFVSLYVILKGFLFPKKIKAIIDYFSGV